MLMVGYFTHFINGGHMKVSLRSIISNVIVAGIILASMPMVAMEAPQQPAQPQAQAPKEESSYLGDKIRQLGEKVSSWHKEYVPNVADGIDGMANKGDSALRDFATSGVGSVGLALLGAFAGLALCHYLTKDKSGVNILEQMLGFFKGIFGRTRYDAMSDRGLDAVEKNGAFVGVMKGVKTVHSVNKAADETKERFNEAGKLADDVAKIGNPIREAWNNIYNFVGNAWSSVTGSEKKPAAQPQATNEQAQPNTVPRTNTGNGVPPTDQTNNNNNNATPQSTGQSTDSAEKFDKEKGVFGMYQEVLKDTKSK